VNRISIVFILLCIFLTCLFFECKASDAIYNVFFAELELYEPSEIYTFRSNQVKTSFVQNDGMISTSIPPGEDEDMISTSIPPGEDEDMISTSIPPEEDGSMVSTSKPPGEDEDMISTSKPPEGDVLNTSENDKFVFHITVDKSSASEGDTLTYVLNVSNKSSLEIKSILIKDILPGELKFFRNIDTENSEFTINILDDGTEELIWKFPPVTGTGESRSIRFEALVK